MFFLSDILDFLSPRFCESCNSKLSQTEDFICKNCLSKIIPLTSNELNIEFQRKFSSTNFVDDYSSLFTFEEDAPTYKVAVNV